MLYALLKQHMFYKIYILDINFQDIAMVPFYFVWILFFILTI